MKFITTVVAIFLFSSISLAELTTTKEKTELGERTTYYRNGEKIFVEEYFDIGTKETGRRYYDQYVILDGRGVLSLSTFLITPKWEIKGIEGLNISAMPEDGLVLIEYNEIKEGFTINEGGLLVPFTDSEYEESCVPTDFSEYRYEKNDKE
ncbi:hypothetical protein VDG1235_400 [Verrucomicrobiia bacterium DG1235]|nr:hypothetical protein VDG1235_400 [Verrucomicrobiae bacterium DG1235]